MPISGLGKINCPGCDYKKRSCPRTCWFSSVDPRRLNDLLSSVRGGKTEERGHSRTRFRKHWFSGVFAAPSSGHVRQRSQDRGSAPFSASQSRIPARSLRQGAELARAHHGDTLSRFEGILAMARTCTPRIT
ncbi:hypothetical protein Q7C36_005862 [Tachysurus vachellii]|uniref:Uncharacterized protein n=1 Tax=Tachysurus vachellii TaxID=175792 RepID=A0AA88NLB3_TACVA|nr:hypothetical protein Q7C36_005862 [Tachysurus vachellii]